VASLRDPVFPFMNNLFRSPYFTPEGLRDGRWAPQSWTDLLTAPAEMALGLTERLQEPGFRDVRYLVLFVVAGAALARTLWSRTPPRPAAAAKVVLVGWLATYAVWATVFHYYRYFAAGEFLAPVAILALLRLAGSGGSRSSGSRSSSSSWPPPARSLGPDALEGRALRVRGPREPVAVLVDSTGISFALPFFPPGSRFFNVDRNGPLFDRLRRGSSTVMRPVVRLRRLGAPYESLERFDLKDEGPCKTFRSGGRGRLSLCRLERLPH
jgi:hypothetical protein